MKLNNEEINRYSRHLTLPEVGMSGQLDLKKSSVLMIGAGGLGSPLGMYLGAVGVGRIGLVDFDVVDHTNLHRQIAHTTSHSCIKSSVGKSPLTPKVPPSNSEDATGVISGIY